MEKVIKYFENEIILNINEDNDEVQITYFEKKNGKVKKELSLMLWDNIYFVGKTKEYENLYTIDFDFYVDNPLYFPLLNFLKEKDYFTLDDDATKKRFTNYITIKKEKEKIRFSFVNLTLSNKNYLESKVFINDINPNIDSKIKNQQVKDKLVNLINDCKNELLDGNHQISIDEHLRRIRISH